MTHVHDILSATIRSLLSLVCCLLTMCPYPLLAQRDAELSLSGQRLDFVENLGQWPSQVLFRSNLDDATLFLENDCFTMVLQTPPEVDSAVSSHIASHMGKRRYHACRLRFLGASGTAAQGLGAAASYENYFIGSDRSRWASRCRLFGTVLYPDLYPGIDMRVYSAKHAMKYEFEVRPGANPDLVAMALDSVRSMKLQDGNLIASTAAGDWIEYRPYSYQQTDTGIVEVASHFVLEDSVVRIHVAPYDTTLPLVIDPYLRFSTYTGSSADNWGTTAAYDSYKNAYTAGLVFYIDYPTSLGCYDESFNGNTDVGIFKFDSTGTQRLYATYLGGNKADMPHSMYVNSLDELVILGTTGSANFPTTDDAYCRTFKGGPEIAYLNSYSIYYPSGSDLFVSRFSADGTQLPASTFLGGSNNDGLNYRHRYNRSMSMVMQGNDSLYYNYGDGARGEIITDNLNNVYIGSSTFSFDFFPFGMQGIQMLSHGLQEGVVVKLDHNLSHILWGTYYGGEGDDAIYSIDVDSEYNLLVCGGTNSLHVGTTISSYHPAAFGGSADAFVAKFSHDGSRLMAATYFGSPAYDQAYFVRCGRQDDVFLFGQTTASGSSLIYNAYYNVPNSGQFLARFSPDLSTLRWSTTFGTGSGRPNISPTAFGVDICNRVYAAGWGRDFVGYNGVNWNTAGTTHLEVTPDAYQATTDGQDFYFLSLTSDAGQLEYATFYGELHNSSSVGGTDHVDGGTSRFDRLGTLYQSVCASCSGASGFPTTPGAWSSTNQSSNCNNALFRFSINDDFAVAEFVQPEVGCAPYTANFHNTGRGASYLWDFGDGTTSTLENPTHQYDSAGHYKVKLTAYLPGGCTAIDSCQHDLIILGNNTRQTEPLISCNGATQQIGLQPMAGCTYRWIQGVVSDSTVANPWVNSDGDYILQVTSDAGCSETDTFAVAFIDLIDTLIVVPASCPNSCDAQVIAITRTQQSVSSLLYDWDGMILPDSILADQCPTAAVGLLTVSDTRCQDTASYIITGPQAMTIRKEAVDVMCSDTCLGMIHLWTDQQVDTTIANLCPGTYAIILEDTLGCTYTDTTVIFVDHLLDSLAAWADDTTIFLTESTTLHSTPIPGATYQWTPDNTLNHPRQASTLATPIDTLTTYLVEVVDSLGCSAASEVTIHCTPVNCGEGNIFIPNAFSPNGDGINDQFCVTGENIVSYHLMIFTRWGEMVFETHSLDQCWDGRHRENWCQPGVYVYSCIIECEAGIEARFKGDITLIR